MSTESKTIPLKDLLDSLGNSSGLVEICRQDPPILSSELFLPEVSLAETTEIKLDSLVADSPKLSRLDQIIAELENRNLNTTLRRDTSGGKFNVLMGERVIYI